MADNKIIYTLDLDHVDADSDTSISIGDQFELKISESLFDPDKYYRIKITIEEEEDKI